MRPAIRDAILRGVGGASEAHDAFHLRKKHEDGLGAIDVFDVIKELGIPVAFEALDKLLGACIRVSTTEVGILLTTQRDLHMQRFTAAHELGHFVLEHEGSLDREVRFPGHTDGREVVEVEADAFAAEFLMPKWLVKATALRRQWWADATLRNPEVVYQLSLRLAASYEATCWGLASHTFVDVADAKALVATSPKEIKHRALREVPLDDPWADVWHLRPGDDGAHLDASPNDLFVVELREQASAGFRWQTDNAVAAGFRVIEDRNTFDSAVVGASASRRLVLQAPQSGFHDLNLECRRSFARTGTAASTFRVSISNVGTRGREPTSPPAAVPTVH